MRQLTLQDERGLEWLEVPEPELEAPARRWCARWPSRPATSTTTWSWAGRRSPARSPWATSSSPRWSRWARTSRRRSARGSWSRSRSPAAPASSACAGRPATAPPCRRSRPTASARSGRTTAARSRTWCACPSPTRCSCRCPRGSRAPRWPARATTCPTPGGRSRRTSPLARARGCSSSAAARGASRSTPPRWRWRSARRRWTTSTRDADRLALAAELGANPIEGPPPRRMGPYPITVDGSVTHDGLACACRSTSAGGTCTSVSVFFEGETPLPLLEMYTTGVHFHTGRAMARASIPEVLALVASGRLAPGEGQHRRGLGRRARGAARAAHQAGDRALDGRPRRRWPGDPERHLVDHAPEPVLARLDRAQDRVALRLRRACWRAGRATSRSTRCARTRCTCAGAASAGPRRCSRGRRARCRPVR